MRVIYIGDIIGRVGRLAVQRLIPDLRKELAADVVIANAENIAHGIGFTSRTLAEVQAAHIDYFTSGNHALDKPDALNVLSSGTAPIIRPANYLAPTAGDGYRIITVGTYKILLINLLGRVFMKENVACPFQTFDAILAKQDLSAVNAVLVDFHAETTSEKVAFGWHCAGRASLVVGTHTHVPTADTKVLPGGTAYVTDLGMVGARDSVIGVVKDAAIQGFITGTAQKFSMPEKGLVDCNMVLVDINPTTRQAKAIERIDKLVEIE